MVLAALPLGPWSSITPRAAVDILVIAVLIYYLLKLLRGTRAVQMLVAIALLAVFYRGAQWARLEMVEWLLTTLLPYVAIALIVLFQPEIRRALSRVRPESFPDEIRLAQPKGDLRRHRDGRRIFFAESHRRAHGRGAAGGPANLHRKRNSARRQAVL